MPGIRSKLPSAEPAGLYILVIYFSWSSNTEGMAEYIRSALRYGYTSTPMNEEQLHNSMGFVRECAGNADVHDGLFARPSATAEIDAFLTENGFSVS